MPSVASAARAAAIVVSFVLVAALQSWPLPLHLTTHLTGNPGGDTGVYVWNVWVFHHELLELHSWPLSTSALFAPTGPVDLSLHNYTVFANLIAAPLLPWVGVIGAFNLVYLINVALAALGVFLLVRETGRAAGVRTVDAWLAGLFFACSPFLVARSTAHFSLVAAAPLPFFVLFLHRLWSRHTHRDAIGAGACAAWAVYCDVYYGVYCVLLALVFLAARTMTVERTTDRARTGWIPWLDIPILGAVAACLTAGLSGGVLQFGEVRVSVRSLYTPVLVLTMVTAIRLARTWPVRLTVHVPAALKGLAAPAATGLVTAALLTSPVLYALGVRALEGRMVAPPVLWRSSAPGVDLASFVLPNPNHPFAPAGIREWTASQPGRFEENVAAIPWTVLLLVAIAWRRAAYRPDPLWIISAVLFTLLSAGPFVRLAGLETYVPTPWTLLRYAPIIGQARMPTRFAVLVALSAAVLFAGALAAAARRWPAGRHGVTALVAALLTFELLPVPRHLAAATTPEVFDTIAADDRPLSVLMLPFGIRDGLSSIGDFSAASLLFQTQHGKPLVGGYLSRVSPVRKERLLADPVLAALTTASERRPVTREARRAAREAAAAFLERSRVGWVVVDNSRTSVDLRELATETLRLREVSRSGDFVLFVPEVPGAGSSVRPGASDDAAHDADGTGK